MQIMNIINFHVPAIKIIAVFRDLKNLPLNSNFIQELSFGIFTLQVYNDNNQILLLVLSL